MAVAGPARAAIFLCHRCRRTTSLLCGSAPMDDRAQQVWEAGRPPAMAVRAMTAGPGPMRAVALVVAAAPWGPERAR